MTASTPEPTPPDGVIDALQATTDELVPVAEGLSAAELREETRPGEWTSAAVLSHLGSGAVIALAGLDAALAGAPFPGYEANQPVWDRWDAMEPEQQRDQFVVANAALQTRYAAIDAATRASLRVDLGFLPAPVGLATAAAFRLDELALHSYDVRAARDAGAQVHEDAVPVLVDALLPMMLGFLGRPERLDGLTASLAVSLADPERDLGLELSADGTSLGPTPEAPDGVLTMPAEAFVRLLTGRLPQDRTPAGVGVMGPVSLDALRAAFPGF